jgi:hypothetical protein
MTIAGIAASSHRTDRILELIDNLLPITRNYVA